jgi:hypothetical protein
VTLAIDQKPVGALGTSGTHPPLRITVRPRRATHGPVGCAVTPTTCTLRVRTSITNSTYNRRNMIVSTWKKWHANSPAA